MIPVHDNSTPLILFFSAHITPSVIKEYQRKCMLLEQAVRDDLKVKIKALHAKVIKLNEFGISEGRFYGYRWVNEERVKTDININKIKKLGIVNDVLKITYSVLQ